MPRAIRKYSSSNMYHIVQRGVNKQSIFLDSDDYVYYLHLLNEIREKFEMTLFAYCLMDNHVHLLVEVGHHYLSKAFQQLGSKYATYFNTKYDRSGYLLQGRFFSDPIEENSHFVSVLIYIYRNPIVAGIVRSPEAYPWCSYCKLNTSLGLINHARLFAIVSLEEISELVKREKEKVVVAKEPDASKRYSDREIAEMIKRIGHLDSVSKIPSLNKAAQRRMILTLLDKHVPIRQLARVTSLSKGQIEWLCTHSS